MYARLKSATELQLIIDVLSLFHMFAPDNIVSVIWNNCVRARGTYRSSLAPLGIILSSSYFNFIKENYLSSAMLSLVYSPDLATNDLLI